MNNKTEGGNWYRKWEVFWGAGQGEGNFTW